MTMSQTHPLHGRPHRGSQIQIYIHKNRRFIATIYTIHSCQSHPPLKCRHLMPYCWLFYPYIMKIIPCPSYRRPFVPNPQLKGLFAGSGSAAMNTNYICQAVIDLTKRQPKDLSLLYIGTATYDIDKYREKQTNVFANLGVQVDSLELQIHPCPEKRWKRR